MTYSARSVSANFTPFSNPPHAFLPLDIPFMFILSPDRSFFLSFFRQLSPSLPITCSFLLLSLSSTSVSWSPHSSHVHRKSNKGVGGIRAIRREISSNVELRSPLPLSPLSVKRCRGVGWRGIVPRKSAPSKGFGDNTAGKKRKKYITSLGNSSTIFLSWSRDPNIVHTIFERERERELVLSVQQYRDRLNYSLGFISARSFGRDEVAKVARWKKFAGDVEKLLWTEGEGRGCIYDSKNVWRKFDESDEYIYSVWRENFRSIEFWKIFGNLNWMCLYIFFTRV